MSRIIDILTAIRNGETYTGEPLSRVEAILKSIANKTPYTATARSRHEQLLIAIKNGQTVSGTARTRVEEILFAIANGTIDAYLTGKNLFDAEKAFATTETQDGYRKYTVYTGKPNTLFYVNSNADDSERQQSGLVLKCAAYDYSATYVWLYNANTVTGKGTVKTDEAGRISFYWDKKTANCTSEVVKMALQKMQLTIGSVETPYTSYAFLSDLEEAYYLTANKLKGA